MPPCGPHRRLRYHFSAGHNLLVEPQRAIKLSLNTMPLADSLDQRLAHTVTGKLHLTSSANAGHRRFFRLNARTLPASSAGMGALSDLSLI
jgi:hypothetical protein